MKLPYLFLKIYELPKIIKEQGGKAWHPYHKDITKKIVEISHDRKFASKCLDS